MSRNQATSPPPSVGPVEVYGKASMAPSRTKMRTLIADPEARNEMLDAISVGTPLAELARRYGIRYSVFYSQLRDKMPDEYAAARAAYAESLVQRNLELADDVQDGRVPAQEAKVAAGIRQWFAERADSDTWGQKSSMNVHHTGVVGLHMQALKEFQDQHRQHEEIEDAEFEEVTEEPETPPPAAPKRHRLL